MGLGGWGKKECDVRGASVCVYACVCVCDCVSVCTLFSECRGCIVRSPPPPLLPGVAETRRSVILREILRSFLGRTILILDILSLFYTSQSLFMCDRRDSHSTQGRISYNFFEIFFLHEYVLCVEDRVTSR